MTGFRMPEENLLGSEEHSALVCPDTVPTNSQATTRQMDLSTHKCPSSAYEGSSGGIRGSGLLTWDG